MLNLKITIPLVIFGAGGTAAGNYYVFGSQEKNNEKREAQIIAKTLQKDGKQNSLICYVWREDDRRGIVLGLDDCKEVTEISNNKVSVSGESSYSLLVKREHLKRVLIWHNLLKTDTNIKNQGKENWKIEGEWKWECKSEDKEIQKDFQEVFVECIRKDN